MGTLLTRDAARQMTNHLRRRMAIVDWCEVLQAVSAACLPAVYACRSHSGEIFAAIALFTRQITETRTEVDSYALPSLHVLRLGLGPLARLGFVMGVAAGMTARLLRASRMMMIFTHGFW